jgi:hypothetical protein
MTLVERLRRRHECRERHQTTVHHLINPDGPEAADALETAEKALEESREYVEAHGQEHAETGSALQMKIVDRLNRIDAALEKIRSGR